MFDLEHREKAYKNKHDWAVCKWMDVCPYKITQIYRIKSALWQDKRTKCFDSIKKFPVHLVEFKLLESI